MRIFRLNFCAHIIHTDYSAEKVCAVLACSVVMCDWSSSEVLKALPHIRHKNCGWLPGLGSLVMEISL